MNKIYIFASIAISSVTSAVTGFFIGKKITEKKVSKDIEEDLKKLTDYYENKSSVNKTDISPVKKETKVEEPKEDVLPNQTVVDNSLSDLLTTYGATLEEQKPTKRGRPKKGAKAAIREIELEQYGNSEYPAETLIMHPNGIMLDGYGTIISDPVAYVGVDGMERITSLYSVGDPDQLTTLYFKNDILGIDFEVELSAEDFIEEDNDDSLE